MNPRLFTYLLCIGICALSSCKQFSNENSINKSTTSSEIQTKTSEDTIVVDCNYSFEEAIAGTKAPQKIIDQLTLIQVQYYSFDSLLHQGQIVCHKSIANDLKEIFDFILETRFPVGKVIPMVKYNESDPHSMNDNNSYCFCYRNASYSKHASGLAFDLNPMQNPLRWKKGYEHRKDLPENASYNPAAPGTLYPQHPVVLKFEEKGFRWGHHFKRNHDDHHFEKRR